MFESEEARGWPKYSLGELALMVQNGIYKKAEFYGSGEPFLRMYNIDNNSWRLNQRDLAKVLLNEAEKQRFQLAAGDLLISRVNSHELVGKCGIVGTAAEGYVFENMLIRVRLAEEVEPMFMAQQFATRGIREALRNVAKRAIGQSSINSTDLKKLQIRLPARERQVQLAAELDARLDSALEITGLVDQEFSAISATPPALLRQAFSGAL